MSGSAINLRDKLAQFQEHWSPRVIAEMNAYRFKLLFGAGSLFALVARQVLRKHWLAVVAGVAAAFLYVWAELAAGIFTSLGS